VAARSIRGVRNIESVSPMPVLQIIKGWSKFSHGGPKAGLEAERSQTQARRVTIGNSMSNG
jgi:hypothetical protein